MSAILCTEFGGQFFGTGHDEAVVFLYLFPPFGWRASPGYFSLVGNAITAAHSDCTPRANERGGNGQSESQIFADDAIFIEPKMGYRLENVAWCWEYVCCRMLGPPAINREKLDLEGKWEESQIILGFDVNVEKLTIELPKVKISNANESIMNNMIGHGKRVVTVKCVQNLRGLFNHWRYSGRFWHHFRRPSTDCFHTPTQQVLVPDAITTRYG